MKIVVFCHSLVSDWNHGNAHFLRGVVAELLDAGYAVSVYEPRAGWSRAHLIADQGPRSVDEFTRRFPALASEEYDLDTFDLDRALDHADLVLVHEWSDPALVAAVGRRRAAGGRFVLLFHDTHHRAVTAPDHVARFDLSAYDGVLAFGEVIRRIYLIEGWAHRAFTWHEAADTRVFVPLTAEEPTGDLVWIGNWGDGERSRELAEYLLGPARRLRLSGSVYGVRFPRSARSRIRGSGLRYQGWLANHRVPEAFAAHRLTVHVPRGPYVRALPGIPTIRVFEALACGIPLVSAPWNDAESLFSPGEDYLVARDGAQMTRLIDELLCDPVGAAALAARGLETIRARHTCAHRVRELLDIHARLAGTAVSEAMSR